MYSQSRLVNYCTNTLAPLTFFILHLPPFEASLEAFLPFLSFSLIDVDSNWHVEIELANADLELDIKFRQRKWQGKIN